MAENLKAILFDMDGVLIDSEPIHFEANLETLKRFGIDLSESDYLSLGVGKGDHSFYQRASEKFGITVDIQTILKIKKDIYKSSLIKKGKLMPGVLDALKYLSTIYDLAIVSSGLREINDLILDKFSLRSYFREICNGNEVSRVKPFPDLYLRALEALGYSGNECVAVEDSETGVLAAVNAGIKCIAIPNDFTRHQNFSGAYKVIPSIQFLTDYLRDKKQRAYS